MSKKIRVGNTTMQITRVGRSHKVTFMKSGRLFSAIDRDRESAIKMAIDLLAARQARFGIK